MVTIYKWLMNEACAGRKIYAECPGENERITIDAKTFKNIERRNANFTNGEQQK